MDQLVYNSNKAMVSYLIKRGCKVKDVKLGKKDTLLFGFNPEETRKYVDEWTKETDSLIICKNHQGTNRSTKWE